MALPANRILKSHLTTRTGGPQGSDVQMFTAAEELVPCHKYHLISYFITLAFCFLISLYPLLKPMRCTKWPGIGAHAR